MTVNKQSVILNEVKNPRNKGRSGCIVVRTPIFVYALPLQRESILPEGWYFADWILRITSSPTVLPFQAILHYVQDDRLFDYRHVERKRNISRKGGIFRSLYKKTKSRNARIFLRSDFNHIVNLFVNYIIWCTFSRLFYHYYIGVSTILRPFTQNFHLTLKIYLIFTPIFQRFCS